MKPFSQYRKGLRKLLLDVYKDDEVMKLIIKNRFSYTSDTEVSNFVNAMLNLDTSQGILSQRERLIELKEESK